MSGNKNKNCIIRLSRYKNALRRLKTLGFFKVFSDNLADAVETTSSQVRKDFALFGITGNKRGGYIIDELIEKLDLILGKDQIQKVVLIGAGNMGTALMKYQGFEKENIKIIAAFDLNPGKQTEFSVLPISELAPFIKKNNVKIGIIAVPDIAAAEVADIAINAGIKGLLNFAPIRLKGDENTIINSVNLVSELENVIYFVSAAEKTKKNRVGGNPMLKKEE